MTVIRLGIVLLVAFAVISGGAVQSWSQAVLEIGAAILMLSWGLFALRSRCLAIGWSWLFFVAAAFLGFALLQSALGFSAYPYATKIELLKSSAYLTLSFLAVQSFASAKQRARFAWFLIALGFSVSLVGIIQCLAPGGQIDLFWLLPGRTPNSFGPYVNPNHFAGFVELTCPMAIAMLLAGAVPKERILLVGILAAIPTSALILSGSRGGLASFLIELALLGVFAWDRTAAKRRLVPAVGLAVLVAALVVALGAGKMLHRLAALSPAELSHDRRISLFRDTTRVFVDHPWAGTGLGTLQIVFPRYETFYDGLIVDHAHNDYIELLADMGLAGAVFGLLFVGIVFWRAKKNLQMAQTRAAKAFYLGALAACFGLLLHSFTDFNLHIPANALLFFVLASLLTSSSE